MKIDTEDEGQVYEAIRGLYKIFEFEPADATNFGMFEDDKDENWEDEETIQQD